MGRLADLVEENQELLATIDAWDNGNPNQQPATIGMWYKESS